MISVDAKVSIEHPKSSYGNPLRSTAAILWKFRIVQHRQDGTEERTKQKVFTP